MPDFAEELAFDDKAEWKPLLLADLGLGSIDICWSQGPGSEIYSNCRRWFVCLHLEILGW